MPRRKIIAFFVFACAFCVTLIVQAPAALLGTWVKQSSHGSIELADSSGTIWRGSATPMLSLKSNTSFPLERIGWSISFFSIFTGKIKVQLRVNATPQRLPSEVYFSARQVELRNIALELPATVLGEFNPLLQGMGLQGQVQMSTEDLVIQHNGTTSGKIVANWLMAGSALSPVNPFGSYRFDLTGLGGRIQIRLSTISGDLQLNGQGEWLTSNRLSFQSTAKAIGTNKDVLAEMLRHLGPEIEPGIFSFKVGQ